MGLDNNVKLVLSKPAGFHPSRLTYCHPLNSSIGSLFSFFRTKCEIPNGMAIECTTGTRRPSARSLPPSPWPAFPSLLHSQTCSTEPVRSYQTKKIISTSANSASLSLAVAPYPRALSFPLGVQRQRRKSVSSSMLPLASEMKRCQSIIGPPRAKNGAQGIPSSTLRPFTCHSFFIFLTLSVSGRLTVVGCPSSKIRARSKFPVPVL